MDRFVEFERQKYCGHEICFPVYFIVLLGPLGRRLYVFECPVLTIKKFGRTLVIKTSFVSLSRMCSTGVTFRFHASFGTGGLETKGV